LAELALTTTARGSELTGYRTFVLETAVKSLAVHGFIGSVLLGAIYYILPRVLQGQWASEKMIRVHFNSSTRLEFLLVLCWVTGGRIAPGNEAGKPLEGVHSPSQRNGSVCRLSTLGILLLLVRAVLLVINLFKLVRTFRSTHAADDCSE
jgi:cbb3-type cytochrome oxidase subunit 1